MYDKFTFTENGALQLRTGGSRVLDLFAEIASAREVVNDNPKAVLDLFANAVAEDAKTAMAVMFWVRAVRLGAGERDVFDALFGFAYRNFPEFIDDNLELVSKLGYRKDYVKIAAAFPELEGRVADIFARELKERNYFAAKWLPRKSRLRSLVRNRLGMSNAEFRRFVSSAAETVEQKICAGKIGQIDYSKVPSKAFNTYRLMFLRKDRERFLKSALTGKINTGAVYPHEVLKILFEINRPLYRGIELGDIKSVVEAQWRNLPDLAAPEMRIVSVLDTSASMAFYGADKIAYPLAIYCAERLKGEFKDKIISFSASAKYLDLSNLKSVSEKLAKLLRTSIVENTNIVSVFDLLLKTALKNGIPQAQMPNAVLILSDMQFDEGADMNITLMDKLKLDFERAGYDFPALIYWNLSATNTGIAASKEADAAFISGFNPKILADVFKGTISNLQAKEDTRRRTLDPEKAMREALEPILKMIDFKNLAPIPESFASFDYNETRGRSARRRCESQKKAKSLSEALACGAT